MPATRALYHRACPKIAWAPVVGENIVTVDLADYLSGVTENDPQNVITFALSTDRPFVGPNTIKSTITGVPAASPYTGGLLNTVPGADANRRYVASVYQYPEPGSTFRWNTPVGRWTQLAPGFAGVLSADGSGNVDVPLGFLIEFEGGGYTVPAISHLAHLQLFRVEDLDFGFPLSRPVALTMPTEASERTRYPSGEETAWLSPPEAVLDAVVFGIPAEDGNSQLAPATGWDGVNGWRRFLEHAWAGHTFEFWRDRDDPGSAMVCQLLEPRIPPSPGAMATRTFPFRIRSVTGDRFTGY